MIQNLLRKCSIIFRFGALCYVAATDQLSVFKKGLNERCITIKWRWYLLTVYIMTKTEKWNEMKWNENEQDG